MRWFILISVMLILAGCDSVAPMDNPSTLSATAGAPITITEDRYHTDSFSTWYDPSWKVVSSASFDVTHAYFISPDEDALILIASPTHNTDNIYPPAVPNDTSLAQQMVSLSDDLVIYLITTDDLLETYQAVFQRTADSVIINE